MGPASGRLVRPRSVLDLPATVTLRDIRASRPGPALWVTLSVMLRVSRLSQPPTITSGRWISRATVLTSAWVRTGPVRQQAGILAERWMRWYGSTSGWRPWWSGRCPSGR